VKINELEVHVLVHCISTRFAKTLNKCCRNDRQIFLPSNAAPQPSSLHPNDILVNIKWNPCIDQGTILDERSTWRPRSSSMYDMLHELQNVKNAYRKD
jgi:hypothetical protein